MRLACLTLHALLIGLCWTLVAPDSAWAQVAPEAGADASGALRRATTQASASDSATKAAGLATLAALSRSPAARIAGAALFALGAEADAAGEQVAAIALYRDALARDPGGRFARRAHHRLAMLAAVPDEERAIVVAFEALLRLPPDAVDSATRAQQIGALLERAHSPELRGRLLRWQVEDALAAGDHARAFERALVAAAEPGQRPLAVRVAFERALVAGGDARLEALRVALEDRISRDPALAEAADLERVLHEVADRSHRRVAVVLFVASALILLGFAVRVRAWRATTPARLRAWRPWRGLLFLVWAFGAAAFLAARFEPRMGLVVGACGVAIAPVQVLAGAIGQMGGPRTAWGRTLLGLAIIGSTLGACYIVLARTGQQALMGL